MRASWTPLVVSNYSFRLGQVIRQEEIVPIPKVAPGLLGSACFLAITEFLLQMGASRLPIRSESNSASASIGRRKK